MIEHNQKQVNLFKNSIAKRLTIYILLFSSLVTLIGTSLQLYLDYSEDINTIKVSMYQVEVSHLPGIIANLWVSDSEHIETELTGILGLPDMQYLEIIKGDDILFAFGSPQIKNVISQTYSLDYPFRGKMVHLGMLTAVASLDGVHRRLWSKVLVILTTQAIKTFLVSIFILFLFYHLVGRHLRVMARYANTLDFDHLDNPLVINQRETQGDDLDELSSVAFAINSMRINLRQELEAHSESAKELTKSHALLEAIINGTTDAIFVKNIEGRYLLANRATCQAIDKTQEEVLGKNDQELFPEKSAQVINNVDSTVIKSGETQLVEERLETAYGDTFWLVNKSPFRDQNNTIIGLIGISRNITDIKKNEAEKEKLENRLQQAQKMEAIGTLAGGIAHDFNNMLGAIFGYTEMAQDDTPKGSSIYKNLDKVLQASFRAKSLVKQILAFSHQSAEERILLRPASIITETIKILRPSIPTTIEIQQDIGSKTGNILADPTQLHQILMNLCTNAFHAMEYTGGKLDISLKETELSRDDLVYEPKVEAGTFIQISVCDSGSGITTEVKDKIFEPFFTTKSVGKGTGMGLSIVHGIVKSYGGFISLYSEPGEGTAFHVFLPVILEEVEAKFEDDDQIMAGKERILFVDDEELLSEMGKDMLERIGYHVTAKTNSTEALKIFQNNPHEFDLVITDQTMPGMTGSDIAQRMIQIRPDIPIILCTGYSTIISENEAKSFGIKEFALKPLLKKEIAKLIRKVLDADK